jgi:hypothetical protein
MTEFINGLIVALDLVAAHLFLKFWLGTRDRLFAMFAISFAILAVSRMVLMALPHFIEAHSEHTTPVYLVRLLSYVVMLLAIIDRNRRSAASRIDA